MDNASTVTASYATGAVTSGTGAKKGGWSQHRSGATATITASYWDTETGGITGASAGAGKTTSELQSPTAYGTGIYAGWNVNVDGVTGNDDPWNFGNSSQYPALKYGGLDILTAGRATIVLSTDALSVAEGASNGATYTVAQGGPPRRRQPWPLPKPTPMSPVNPASLTFTANSWNVPQTVTVKAADDTILVDGSDTLTHTAAGAGSGFESVSASLTVTIEDTSTPGIALTQNSVAVTALTVDEEAATSLISGAEPRADGWGDRHRRRHRPDD